MLLPAALAGLRESRSAHLWFRRCSRKLGAEDATELRDGWGPQYLSGAVQGCNSSCEGTLQE